jgi:hypothetical protein
MSVLKDQEMEREKGMGRKIGSAKVCDAFDAEPRLSAKEAGQPETHISIYIYMCNGVRVLILNAKTRPSHRCGQFPGDR